MKCDYCRREVDTTNYDYQPRSTCNRDDCMEVGDALIAQNKTKERQADRQRDIDFERRRQAEIRIKKEAETLGCEYSDEHNEQNDYENSLIK